MTERYTETARWPAYVMALGATFIAVAIRWLLEPLLAGQIPFVLLFASVAVSVWIGGWQAALLAAISGYAATSILFAQPNGPSLLQGSANLTAAALYLVSCGVIIAIGETLHAARRETRGHVLTLERETAAHREVTSQLASTLQNIAEGVSRFSSSWHLSYANEEQQRMYGRVASALLQPTTLWEIWPALAGKPLEAALRQCMSARTTIEAENYDSAFDRWYGVRAYPSDDGGIVMLLRDITPQKRVEAALRRGEEDYRRLFELSAVGNVELALPDGRMVRINQCFRELLQYSAFELEGLTFLEITHPDDREASRLAFEAAIHSQSGRFELEKRYVRKDGSPLWAQLTAIRVCDAAGKPIGLLGSVQNIGARRAALQALRDSELRSRTRMQEVEALFTSSPIGMATCGPDGRFLRINAALAEVAGMPADALNGKTYREVLPMLADMVEPAFAEVLQSGLAVLNRDVVGLAGATAERQREWRMTLYPLFGEQREVLAVSGIFLEVTARKKAEREAEQAAVVLSALNLQLEESYAVLDTLIASAPIGLSFVDRDLRYLRANEALAAINGAPVADHIGRRVEELIPEIWPTVEAMYRKALAGWAVTGVEIPGEVASTPGVQRFWLVSCYPARVDGRVIGVGTVVLEVTSQRLATQALEDADRRKDEFLATLAHELRNPLAPLRNGLQLLKLAPDKARAFEGVEPMMERQLAQMVRLIDDLLDVSRISQGKINLRIKRVPLASVLESAIETSRPLIDAGQHTLT
ncbi:MAG: PAS domain-containing protein, partial [Polaromonas sp.]|nr:PAS domain-containing protein [Polaromonas sp.]